MLKSLLIAAGVVGGALLTVASAQAQEVTLRLHQFLPAQAPVPANFIAPWAEKVEAESGGRIKVELFPAMQLGGRPPALIDQVTDGAVDIIWTLPGYTPGRFPKSEVFDLPFIAADAETTSRAAWRFYEKHLQDEYASIKPLAVHVHGPGNFHMRAPAIEKLEDLRGRTVRGPTRMITQLLTTLGASPVGMPVPQVPESLSRNVIDGTVIPWEVTRALRVAELVNTHTEFAGGRSFYTTFFVFAMNKNSYDRLPDDLKAVIDANSGLETSAWVGRVMDEGDVPARDIAVERNNTIVTIDGDELERWKAAAEPVIQSWIDEMTARGINAEELVSDLRTMIEEEESR